MGSKAPSWADQWGGLDDEKGDFQKRKEKKKMAEVKAAATAGFDKAKAMAAVGAHKMKIGTSSGLKWIKDQYQNKSSSK